MNIIKLSLNTLLILSIVLLILVYTRAADATVIMGDSALARGSGLSPLEIGFGKGPLGKTPSNSEPDSHRVIDNTGGPFSLMEMLSLNVTAPFPELSSVLLLGIGLAGSVYLYRRKRE
jgi:hypothetical protein